MSTRRPWTWPWLIGTSAARGALAVLVGLALWGAVPALVGWHPTTVSSGSMLPRLHVGDVAVSRPLGPQPPAVGSVLLFPDPDRPDRLRLHRFVGIDDDGRLVTRGDANPGNDSTPVDPASVIGIGTLRVPYLGLPVIWWRTGEWVPLALLVLGLTALTLLAAQARYFTFESSAGHGGPPTDTGAVGDVGADPRAVDATGGDTTGGDTGGAADAGGAGGADDAGAAGGGPARFLRTLGVGTVAGAALLSVAVPSWSAFSDTTTTRAELGANLYFSCANAITAQRPNVLLWYRMDETSATTTSATDSSGNGRTGVYPVTGKTPVAIRSCAPTADTGRAITFNGTSGYLSSPAVSGAAPDTFSVAIRFRTTTARGGKLIGYGSSRTGASASYDRHLYLDNDGAVTFGVFPNAVRTITSADGLNDGAWHQAIGTLSPAGLKLYVDGELIGSDPDTTTAQALSGGYWRIAYDNLDAWPSAPTSRFFAGTLDDAVVYTTALTADQVKAQWVASQPA